MGVTLTKTEVLNNFKKAHKDKYTYDKFNEYISAKNKITITCPEHGDFEQRVRDHAGGQGCPSCGKTKRNFKQTSDKNEFINKSISKHGKLYEYDKVIYTKSSNKVEIVCPIHGSFWKTPNKHLIGQGCPKCTNAHRRTQQDFLDDSVKVHGYLYDYSKAIYENGDTNVIIICPIHGEFTQTPYTHIKKECGCPSCSNYGFKYHNSAILYYLKIEYTNTTVYKIGITNRTIEERFSLSDLQKIEVLYTKDFNTGYEAFKIEQKILKENICFKYRGSPLLESNGNTELFIRDISDSVKQYFIGSSINL